MPINGKPKVISRALPVHIEAVRLPQNSSGLRLMTGGLGWMLWIVMALTSRAMTAFGAMPGLSSAMS